MKVSHQADPAVNRSPAGVKDRPNVIWFFGDQHRAQATGYAGDPNLHTPNLDRLAATGLEVTQAVGGCPLCCPFRGSLLTGRYPHHAVPGHEQPLPDGMPTVAQPFNDAGYRTAYLGKWHVDGFQERSGRAALHTVPRDRRGGFQQWLGYENNNSQFDCYLHGHDEDQQEVAHYRLPTYETDAVTDLAIDYIQRRGETGGDGQPFFLAVSVQPPHGPYIAPASWMGQHNPGGIRFRSNVPDIPRIKERAGRQLAGYYAMIENLDHNLGRIREALAGADIDDRTHIVFFSDHGDLHGSHGQFMKTSPLEESLRVPCIIGGFPEMYQTRSGQLHAPVNHVDYAPTSLGLCGIEAPPWMEGHNYAPHRFHGAPVMEPPDSAYCQLVQPTGHGHSIDRPWRCVVTRDGWKYACLEHQPWLMFNLNEDPYEQANLAFNTAFAEQRKRLHDRLARWCRETGDEFALPAYG